VARVRTGRPKQRGRRSTRCTLRVARRSAVQHRADTIRQLKAVVVTAPEALRAQLRNLPTPPSSTPALLHTAAALGPAVGDPLDVAVAEPLVAAKVTLRTLARRWQRLSEEIAELKQLITPCPAAVL
jgi:transposase